MLHPMLLDHSTTCTEGDQLRDVDVSLIEHRSQLIDLIRHHRVRGSIGRVSTALKAFQQSTEGVSSSA